MNDVGSTEILATHTPELFAAAVGRAVEFLRRGDLVALPTETVYGLAANALNADAVQRIFEVKGRPARNPIIVHVADLAMARACASDWPAGADALAAAFWPGPLTLVVPRASRVPEIVAAGGQTVGVRWPSHPFIQAVIRECGFPLAAPSANLSNQLSPTAAEHVRKSLAGRIPLVVDGGPAQVGLESTVLDLTASPPSVLRPGMISREALQAVIGRAVVIGGNARSSDGSLRSPGQLPKHYAPKARLMVLNWRDDADLAAQLRSFNTSGSGLYVLAHTRVPSHLPAASISVIPHDPIAFARALYAELHRCDEAGACWIVVEAVPPTPEWQAIADRLQRAAA